MSNDLMESCIIWAGYKNRRGYGCLMINGKSCKAHRIAYEKYYGDFDKSLCVCHKCDNPSCVNPNHLFLGTHKQNMEDMAAKKRNRYPDNSGEKNGSRKLSARSVKLIRQFLFQDVPGIEIAKAYNISRAQVSKIKNNRKWRQ